MSFLYSIIIYFYGILLFLARTFSKKARKWNTSRIGWYEYIAKKKTKNCERYGWIHCSSAGEFEQAIPIIQCLKNKDSKLKIKIAVSFFSSSGFEMYEKSNLADLFFYFPLDTKSNAQKVVEILQPTFAIFIRNEIWWNILNELKVNRIQTYLVNANLQQKRNFIYRYYLKKAYPLFTKIMDTQTVGNTKLERAIGIKNELYSDTFLEEFCKNSLVVILGSSWATEENFIANFFKKYKNNFPNLKIIIAPHEFDCSKKAELEKLIQLPVLSYLESSKNVAEARLLFLDKKGILKFVYRFADIAFIGGGFEKTVHNITEASVYGLPVLFGPNHTKFEEITEMINLQIAFPVATYAEFENKLLALIENTAQRKNITENCSNYFSKQESCAQKVVSEIFS